MAKKMIPMFDGVVVERAEPEEKSKGGIVLPGNQEKPVRGRVCAVGAGKRSDDGTILPMTVTVGDEVVFTKYSGTDVNLDGKTVLLIKESDILAKIESGE